ncbi:MAG: NADH-quinone oxidoreductase subunit H [Agriterribacter sp.]
MSISILALDWAFVIEKMVLIAIVISVSLVVAMYATYAERKVAGVMQDRHGPNRAGPFGILQPLADGLKLFFKEEVIPNNASRWLFILAMPCYAYGNDDIRYYSLGRNGRDRREND